MSWRTNRTGAWVLIAIVLACVVRVRAADRPNVVLFIADDLTATDCRPYAESGIRTPNMQRLAAAGMTFDAAFVASPTCAPSRAALLTGLYPARNGALFNHQLPDAAHRRWPAYFKDAGYEVVAIGKVAHYAQVRDYGFDFVSHFEYHQDDCVSFAVDWLAKRKSDKPLCLLVGTNWPHVPWPKETSYDATLPLPPTMVDTPETRQFRARYAEAVTRADHDLGEVYDASRQHLGDNTLFLCTADHGAQFPFGKWTCYDAGLRTPLIAVWPGKVAANVRTDALVSWVDLLPTCLAAIDVVPPASGDAKDQLSGQSFLDVLTGKTETHRELIYASHSGDGTMNDYPARAVRSSDYKYIRNLKPGGSFHAHIDLGQDEDGRAYWASWVKKAVTDSEAAAVIARYHRRPAEELYDVLIDPFELTNLAGKPEYGTILASYRAKLDAWMKAQGDEGLATEATHALKP